MFSFQAPENTGTIKGFNGSTPPDGWLFCDGSAISRTTYANLFSVIGTSYGSGNGTTTFNLPNWQSVVSAVTIPTSIAVYGNGKVLSFYNGTKTGTLIERGSGYGFATGQAATGSSVGASSSLTDYTPNNIAVGLSTATNGNSGIVAKSNSITRTAFSSKFIIKY